MSDITIHPAADLFPMMDDESFAELVNDIREQGQHEPVVLWRGSLIDGRNRLKACQQLGVEPDTHVVSDDIDPLRWVVSANLHRRHLTQSQKAMIAAKLLPLYEEEAKFRMLAGKARDRALADATADPTAEMPEGTDRGEAREKAAAAVGVSPRLVSDAKAILKASPEVAAQVSRGEMSIGKAKGEVSPPKPTPTHDPATTKSKQRCSDDDSDQLLRLWPSFDAGADTQDDDLRLCMMIAGPGPTAMVTARANSLQDAGKEWDVHPMLLGFVDIIHGAPDLFEAVHNGRMTMSQALARFYFESRFSQEDA